MMSIQITFSRIAMRLPHDHMDGKINKLVHQYTLDALLVAIIVRLERERESSTCV